MLAGVAKHYGMGRSTLIRLLVRQEFSRLGLDGKQGESVREVSDESEH